MLDKIKNLIGFDIADTDPDEKLMLLISLATARLKVKIGNVDPPEELDYIIIDIVVARFNRIGSEGLTSHSVEGENLTFTEDDFKPYESDIQSYLNRQKNTTKGKVCFL